MGPNPQETADLVTFTEEILNGKLPFLCNEIVKFGMYFCTPNDIKTVVFLTFAVPC